jgi:clan AA aspartic protease
MLSGRVNAFREAILRITVRGPAGGTHEADVVVDTGYDGFLTLPSSIVSALDLPFRRRASALLADGSQTVYDVHERTVLWDGKTRRIAVDVAETDPLLGMALLEGHELCLQVIEDGPVTVQPILAS